MLSFLLVPLKVLFLGSIISFGIALLIQLMLNAIRALMKKTV